MNRIELEQQIIHEGKKRGIIVTRCRIYDRGAYLEFYPEIRNDTARGWVCEFTVEELIDDLAPLGRRHKINKIELATRDFVVGDMVEMDRIWIRLDAGEKEPKNLIKVGSCAGQWRSGWVKGKVVTNDRFLAIKFSRDIWYEEDHHWWGSVQGIEEGIRNGQIKKIDKGQPLYCGTQVWTLRKA